MSINSRGIPEAFDPARDLQCDGSSCVPSSVETPGLSAAALSPDNPAAPGLKRGKFRIAATASVGRPLRGGFAKLEGLEGRELFCSGNEKGELYFFELRDMLPVITGRIVLQGAISARPIFHEGLVFCVTGEGGIYAIRTTPGDEGWPLRNSIEWRKKMKKGIMTAPVAAPGPVLITPYNGFYALSAAGSGGTSAGAALWGASINGTMSTPCFYENIILIGTEDRRLMAFGCGHGKPEGRWERGIDAPCRTSPAVAPAAGVAAAVTIEGTLFCAEIADGKRRWNFRADSPVPGGVAAGCRPAGECFFFGTESGIFYCMDMQGRVVWEFNAGGSIGTEPLFHEGMVFFGAGENRLVCLDVSSGRELSGLEVEGKVSTRPMVTGSGLLFGTTAGKIYSAAAD